LGIARLDGKQIRTSLPKDMSIRYIPVDPEFTGDQAEQKYCDLVREVKSAIGIPVAVKLGPYFSAPVNMAKRLEAAGADGLVLFNRFYQPDFDLEALEVVPNLILSNQYELLLRLHWIAVLYGNVKPDLALTGGVHSATDVVKSHDGRGQGRHDDFRSAQERHQLSRYDADRVTHLARRPRIRFHPPDAGQYEPQRRTPAAGL